MLLDARPRKQLAVVTCMDARIDPLRLLELERGDAHVIRNAGGIVNADALRSLVLSHHLLGTQEAYVIGHTECGSLTFTNDELHARLGPGSYGIDFEPFTDVDARVRESVDAVHASTLLPESFRAHGFVYDVRSDELRPLT